MEGELLNKGGVWGEWGGGGVRTQSHSRGSQLGLALWATIPAGNVKA